MNEDNFYAAPSAQIHDPYGYGGYGGAQSTAQVLLATRGSRLAASMLDGFIAGVVVVPFFIIIAITGGFDGADSGLTALALLGAMMLALLCLGIFNLILLHKNGQTIGKKIMKIKIVRSDLYTPASLVRIIFLRSMVMGLIGAVIPVIGSLVQLADYLFIFGAEQRCLHDMIADTHVIQASDQSQFAAQAAAAYNNSYTTPPSSDW